MPARRALYRSVTFRTWTVSQAYTDRRLAESLYTYDHLRPFVRQVCLHSAQEFDMNLLRWLDLFPVKSLRNFTYVSWPRQSFNPEVFTLRAVRTVPHLTANGPHDVNTLQACLKLPYMVTLELDLTSYEHVPLYGRIPVNTPFTLNAALAPRLKELFVHVPHLPMTPLMTILATFAPQLDVLHIHISPGRLKDAYAWRINNYATEFVQHARQIRKVVLSGFPRWESTSDVRRVLHSAEEAERAPPILDSLVGPQSKIEHLGCVRDMYTARMLQRMTPRVQALEFYEEEGPFRCEPALLDLLARVREDGLALRTVTVFSTEESRAHYGAIGAACESNGVEFQFTPVVHPVHQPPTRPPVIWD